MASGDFNVVCTDENGCEVEAVIFNVTAGLSEYCSYNAEDDEITVFPNPVYYMLTINSRQNSINEISIYNLVGELVLRQTAPYETIDCRLLSSGIYWIEIKANEKRFRTKFSKFPSGK